MFRTFRRILLTAVFMSAVSCDLLPLGGDDDPIRCGEGDVNLNGIPMEIADAVMFTNYFIEGRSAFGPLIAPERLNQTDVNCDGEFGTVADLVWMIRTILGDAQAHHTAKPTEADVTFYNMTLGVNREMGAAHIVVAGNVTPSLLATNMEMKYGYNGTNTNILIYSLEAHQSFSGNFLQVPGEIISLVFATYGGGEVISNRVPSDQIVLEQNYPNPFCPRTTFDFAIPGGGAWQLDIRGPSGGLVAQFSGVAQSGYGSVEWDASHLPSGYYYYTLTASGQSISKKAILLC